MNYSNPGTGTKGWANLLRALRHRNYRLFFIGQGISLIGTWTQQLAMGWLAYRLTRSPLLLGVIGFTSQIPTLAISPFAGVLADRLNRHRILVITQTLSMIQALTLAGLVLTGIVSFPWLLGLSLFLGLVNSFDVPVRQSFVIQMIENREDLGNAIALNSSLFNMARIIGPSVAGILITWVGEGICFLINGLSYLAVIWALLAMKIPPWQPKPRETRLLDELHEGFSYSFSFPPIRAILLLIALISLMGMSYSVIMPVFVKEILHGEANTLGFLMGSVGLGALLAGLFLASRKSVVGLEKYIPIATAVVGLGLMAFSYTHSLSLALPVIFMVGFGMVVQTAACNTIIQTVVEESKRGRVISIYTTAFIGMSPFGSLIAGSLAHAFGTPTAFLIGGIACFIGAVIFAGQIAHFHHAVRPIYLKLGLVAERTSGTQTVGDLTVEPFEDE